MIAKAIKIAAEAHDGQYDKGGDPYILHCLAVMHGAAALAPLEADTFRMAVMVVGVLHDAVEDTYGIKRSNIVGQIQSEFGPAVAKAVTSMTKERDEDYSDYIERVARNPIARLVKIADLTHNMDTGRLPEGDIGEKDFERWDKYRRALVRLKRGN